MNIGGLMKQESAPVRPSGSRGSKLIGDLKKKLRNKERT